MSASEWEQRIICPDGNCVGVVGAGGTCNVCGRLVPNHIGQADAGSCQAGPGHAALEGAATLEGPWQGAHPGDPGRPLTGDAAEVSDRNAIQHGSSDARDAQVAAAGDDSWSRRRLCSDGACVGVINDDGRCGLCGKPP